MSASDELVQLLGREFADPQLRDLLKQLGVPWQPRVTAELRNDWISFANVELGFEEAGYFLGLDAASGSSILQQVCFYASRAGDAAVPILQPAMGLSFATPRAQARAALEPKSVSWRYGQRDAFDFERYTACLGYADSAANIDTVLMLANRAGRSSRAAPPLGFAELRTYFGLPWYDARLRTRLYSLANDPAAVGQIKSHGTCSLMREAGVRLLYEKSARTWILKGCEIYRARVLDAATWVGDLPGELAFRDSPETVSSKLGSSPREWHAGDLEAYGSWATPGFNVVVTFDLIVNLIASVRVTAASG